MRPDLLEAQACVNWVPAQLPSLHERLEHWLNDSVTIGIVDTLAPATHNPVVAIEKELLPIEFSVEVGAYINALRSGLDILAMSLVKKHRLPIADENVYFPIREDEASLAIRGGPH